LNLESLTFAILNFPYLCFMGIKNQNPEIAAQNIRLQSKILWVGMVLFLIKILAWWLTSSNAIFSDALESLVNIAAGSMGLYSLYLAALPRDYNHPYGHGKIEFISATIEGALISIAGSLIILKAIYNFIFPVELSALDLGLALTASTGIANGVMGFLLQKRGNNVHSITLIASGKHLLSDAWSTAGLVLGMGIIILTGIFWLDNVIALCFGLYIIYTGFMILRKSIAGIMDEMDLEVLKPLLTKINLVRRDRWIDMHNLRIIKYGVSLHVDCHITVPWYLNVKEAHFEVDALENLILESEGRPVEWFIHVDPCHAGACKICQIHTCPVRWHPFEKKVDWNESNILMNQNHGAGNL